MTIFSQSTLVRCLLLTMIGVLSLQSARKADAIADPATSSGAACYYECVDVLVDCWHTTYNSACVDARDYCDLNCEYYDTPFTAWWIFTR